MVQKVYFDMPIVWPMFSLILPSLTFIGTTLVLVLKMSITKAIKSVESRLDAESSLIPAIMKQLNMHD